MRYFDAHCHIQFDQYEDDRVAVVGAMAEQGVGGLIVGTDAASSRAAAEFVDGKGNLFASVGQHPNHETDEAFDEHMYRNLLMYPGVVAIGECGLDYYRVPRANQEGSTSGFAKQTKGASSAYYRPESVTDELKKKQKELFTRHVRLAGQTKRPLIVHARPAKGSMDAYEDALDIIAEAKKEFGDALTGDLHFFVGNTDIAKKAFELDFTVSYTAVITFARDYDEVIRYAPLDRLLSETDSPYVAPVSRRGQRNDPLSVIDVVHALAEIRGEDEEIVREATLQNAQKLFNL